MSPPPRATSRNRTDDPVITNDVLYQAELWWRLLVSGAEGDRTPDLLSAIQALSQLSYGPRFVQWAREDSNL